MVAHAGECLAKKGPGLSSFPLHSRCRLRWGRGRGVRGVRLVRSSPPLVLYAQLSFAEFNLLLTPQWPQLQARSNPLRELPVLDLPKGFEINHLLCKMTCCKKGTRTFSSDLTVPRDDYLQICLDFCEIDNRLDRINKSSSQRRFLQPIISRMPFRTYQSVYGAMMAKSCLIIDNRQKWPELVPDSCHSFRDLSSVTLVFVPFWNWKRYSATISVEFFSRILQERKVTFFAVTELIRVLLLDDLKHMH